METENSQPATMERHKHPLALWLTREIEKAPRRDGEQPGLSCQVFFALGQFSLGTLYVTETPGVFRFASEGRDQSGTVRTIDRYCTIDLIAAIDVPREAPIIQRIAGAGKIVMPQG